jgi:hypothetical protein
MKEQLISFETAKLAKEKGFDGICDYLWNFPRSNKLETCKHKNSELNKDKAWYSAPTQSLLQKWLREKHSIHVYPLMQREWSYSEDKLEFEEYICMIFSLKDTPDKTILPYVEALDFDCTIHESTYEKALEKGLQEALKLIKK